MIHAVRASLRFEVGCTLWSRTRLSNTTKVPPQGLTTTGKGQEAPVASSACAPGYSSSAPSERAAVYILWSERHAALARLFFQLTPPPTRRRSTSLVHASCMLPGTSPPPPPEKALAPSLTEHRFTAVRAHVPVRLVEVQNGRYHAPLVGPRAQPPEQAHLGAAARQNHARVRAWARHAREVASGA